MTAIKDYQPMTAQDLSSIIKYSIPLWQAPKPDSIGTKPNLSDKVNANLTSLPSANVTVNLSNYGPATMPYGLGPYQVSSHSYGVVGAYLDRRMQEMHDFTDRVPGKQLHTFPVSGNEGLWGFTYLGDVHAWRREDLLNTERGKETDVHECIHTPDEYETRIITWWMMSQERSKYIR